MSPYPLDLLEGRGPQKYFVSKNPGPGSQSAGVGADDSLVVVVLRPARTLSGTGPLGRTGSWDGRRITSRITALRSRPDLIHGPSNPLCSFLSPPSRSSARVGRVFADGRSGAVGGPERDGWWEEEGIFHSGTVFFDGGKIRTFRDRLYGARRPSVESPRTGTRCGPR